MTDHTLPAAAVAEDARLEGAAERSVVDLAHHRWHWTLDESNPDRVTFTEYAAAIHRHRVTVAKQAKGYADWMLREGDSLRGPLSEYVDRANISEERQAAIEAVAVATGTSFQVARQGRTEDVKSVLAVAREKVERGTAADMTEGIEKAGADLKRSITSEKKQGEDRKERHSLRYVAMEGHIANAMRRLREALAEAQDVPFTDEERELIADSLAKLRAVLNLIDIRVTGTTTVDWDAELAKMGGGENEH